MIDGANDGYSWSLTYTRLGRLGCANMIGQALRLTITVLGGDGWEAALGCEGEEMKENNWKKIGRFEAPVVLCNPCPDSF